MTIKYWIVTIWAGTTGTVGHNGTHWRLKYTLFIWSIKTPLQFGVSTTPLQFGVSTPPFSTFRFVVRCLSLVLLYCGHYAVCPTNYWIWLHLWYLLTLLVMLILSLYHLSYLFVSSVSIFGCSIHPSFPVPDLPLCLGVVKHRASLARGGASSCQIFYLRCLT